MTLNQNIINSRKIDEKLSEIIYLSNLGAISYRMGKLNTSIDQYQEALDISRATGYRKNEAKCLGGLALTFSMMGDKKSAIYFYEKSIDINEETGDQHNQAVQLSNLGNEYIDLGYIAQAVIHIEAAISIFEEIQPELAEFNRERVRILRKELNE